jgi:SLT domain-containing protein
MITQPDKGKTIAVIYIEDYTKNLHTFLTKNNIHAIHYNPVKKDQKQIHKTLQQHDLIINKRQVKHLIQKTHPFPH